MLISYQTDGCLNEHKRLTKLELGASRRPVPHPTTYNLRQSNGQQRARAYKPDARAIAI